MQSPKFVLSKSNVLEQYETVNSLANSVSYSSKTNQFVTKILEEETNCFFSVHFENELKHLKDFSRVIFLAQGWSVETIKGLTDKGIDYFVVDNESDLNTLLKFLEDNDENVKLLLRMKLKEYSLKTEKYFVFGMKSDVINKRIKELEDHSKIKTLGVHFHRKTQNMSEWNLQYEISNALDRETLEVIDVVNIGGGLPSEYANTNMDVLDSIFKKIKEFREWLEQREVKMIIEPGRFIAAPSTKLVTKILGIHENNIIVDASVYNADMDALIVPVKLKVENELPKGEGEPYVVKGITPCSMDLFRYRVYLEKPEVGDELIFLNAGAYNFSTDFCDLEKIPTEVVK